MKTLFCFLLLLSVHSSAELLSTPPDRDFALVIVPPYESTAEQKILLQKAGNWLTESLPSIIESVGGAVAGSHNAKDLFVGSSQQIKEAIATKIAESKKYLPNEPLLVNAYFIAWPKSEFGEARLKYGYPVVTLNPAQYRSSAEMYASVNRTLNSSLAYNFKNGERFNFVGASLKLRLEKKINIFSFQVYGGLNPAEIDFKEEGPEVNISKIVIPSAEKAFDSTTMLATIRQQLTGYDGEIVNSLPQVTLDFGTFGGIAGNINNANGFSAFGEIQVSRLDNMGVVGGESDCTVKKAVPTLIGVLADKATGVGIVDKLAQGRDVQFRIFSMNLSIETQRVESMDVRMDLGFSLKCLSVSSVKEKFKNK
ncbi:MAG: hypothetical protein AB7H97_15170, partial [Pseudobdellovibrionaceae bacterium]